MKQTKIAIYSKDATSFEGQGYGILADCLVAQATESVSENGNTQYELELVYPIDGPLSSKLKDTNILKVPINEAATIFQLFEIYDYLDNDNGELTIYAQAIDYRILSMPFDNGGYIKRNGSVQSLLNYGKSLVSGFPAFFALETDIADTISVDDQFDDFGSFLSRILALTHGEVKHDNRTWTLLKSRGKKTDTVLRDDKNTSGLQIKYTYDEIINKIIPIYPNPDEKADSKEIVGSPIISPVAFKYYNYWRGKNIKFDSAAESKNYFVKNPIDQPKITATVSPCLTDENLDQVGLFDYVKIYNHRLNYLAELQVINRSFDCLKCEVIDFTVGDVEYNIFIAQKKTEQKIEESKEETDEKLEEQKNDTDKKIEESSKQDQEYALTAANGRNKNFYGDEEPTEAQEGDHWFKGALGDGPSDMYAYQDGKWVQLFPEGRDTELKKQMEDADAETEKLITDAGFDSAETLYKAVSNNQDSIVTVKANANGLQTQITNNATSTTNRLTSLSNLFDSKITNTQNNLSSQITQKVNSIKLSVSGSGSSSYLWLNGSSVELGGRNVHINGSTYIANGSIGSAAIGNLDAGKIVTGTLRGIDLSGVNITGSSSINLDGGGQYTKISSTWGISTTGTLEVYGWTKFHSNVDIDGGLSVSGHLWANNKQLA